jgi:hypothetical protein
MVSRLESIENFKFEVVQDPLVTGNDHQNKLNQDVLIVSILAILLLITSIIIVVI